MFKKFALILAAVLSMAAGARAQTVPPQPPQIFINSAYTQVATRTTQVAAGANLQAALDNAQPGDEIVLAAGATFTGNFILPAKAGSGWIVIRTSNLAGLTAEGVLVSPANAAAMPKIISPNSMGALATAAGAARYRLVGIELSIAAGVTYNTGILRLGDSYQTAAQVPAELIVDRCYIHGTPQAEVSRGIGLNSGSTAVVDSYISEIHAEGFDTQAICGWNGPGPYKIVNNFLEASGENVMFGGADPSIANLIPSDIEFRRNRLFKPLSWKVGDPSYAGRHWAVKNLFELKNAQRVLVDGNMFENNWADAQTGYAILLKCANQDGTAPWSVSKDVTFTNNIVRRSASAINLLGRDPYNPSPQMERVSITNNLFYDIGVRAGEEGHLLTITEVRDLRVEHNTFIHTGSTINAYGVPSTNVVFANNIAFTNAYGVKGDGASSGLPTLAAYFQNYSFVGNALVGGDASLYPAGNFYPTTITAIGFTNIAAGDYSLVASSPYKGAATDGKDIGCDSAALTASRDGSATNNPPPPPPDPLGDTTAPVYQNLAVAVIGCDGFAVTLTTNEPAAAVLTVKLAGVTVATITHTELVTDHTFAVNGLRQATNYDFTITLTDATGNPSTTPSQRVRIHKNCR